MDETFSRLVDATPTARTNVGRIGDALGGWLSSEVYARLLGCPMLVCPSPALLLQIPTGDKRINPRLLGARLLEYRHGLPWAQANGRSALSRTIQ